MEQNTNEPAPGSTWQGLTSNPLVVLIIGFCLTGVLGVILTNRYNVKQKELEFALGNLQRDREREKDQREKELQEARNLEEKKREETHDHFERETTRLHDDRQRDLEFQRAVSEKEREREKSFADELNKQRVTKISEVWEKLNLLEAATARADATRKKRLAALNVSLFDPNLDALTMKFNEQMLAELGLAKETLDLTLKNRFWLGEKMYWEIHRYIEVFQEYGASIYTNEDAIKKRDKLRQNILRIRKSFLKE